MKSSIFVLIYMLCLTGFAQDKDRTVNFPEVEEKIDKLPPKDDLWIFIMAGQSNMAGRAFVEPQDTISHPRVITINKNNEWVYAKEPLHFYEPDLAGLDSGLSFGKELAKRTPDHITIALLPIAVGGSSVEQWLNDAMHRDVKLLSNFKEKVDFAKQHGTIKGILWHQGESDATPSQLPAYKERLPILFKTFREYIKNDSLPIMAVQLGLFADPNDQLRWDAINAVMNLMPYKDRNFYPIKSEGLTHKGDSLHFNSKSQREIGKRFATQYGIILTK